MGNSHFNYDVWPWPRIMDVSRVGGSTLGSTRNDVELASDQSFGSFHPIFSPHLNAYPVWVTGSFPIPLYMASISKLSLDRLTDNRLGSFQMADSHPQHLQTLRCPGMHRRNRVTARFPGLLWTFPRRVFGYRVSSWAFLNPLIFRHVQSSAAIVCLPNPRHRPLSRFHSRLFFLSLFFRLRKAIWL